CSIAIISGIFLMSTITPGFSIPDRICTSKSVPPAKMRAALPAFANAPIASSSVSGARYRSSVMVFPPSPFCPPAPYERWPFVGPAVRQAYTAGGGWNSLRDQVDPAGSYARGGLAGRIAPRWELGGGPSAVIASAAKQSMPQREDRWIASLRSQ